MDRRIGLAAAAGFIATVWAANWLISHYGVVHVGFGLLAPAGVYAVGVAFTLRDIVHRSLGPYAVMVAILVGAVLSWFIAPQFALASGVAFLVSELCDLLVYSPLRARSWLSAVALSNTVGLAVDSALFLWLAFGSLAFFWGQVVGKAWMTLLAVALIAAWRGLRGREVLVGDA
jgi:queuosine precursor transporter